VPGFFFSQYCGLLLFVFFFVARETLLEHVALSDPDQKAPLPPIQRRSALSRAPPPSSVMRKGFHPLSSSANKRDEETSLTSFPSRW